MQTKTLRLKTALKLKQLRRKMEELADENFGYYPCTPEGDSCIYEINKYEEIARTQFPDLYKHHINSL